MNIRTEEIVNNCIANKTFKAIFHTNKHDTDLLRMNELDHAKVVEIVDKVIQGIIKDALYNNQHLHQFS